MLRPTSGVEGDLKVVFIAPRLLVSSILSSTTIISIIFVVFFVYVSCCIVISLGSYFFHMRLSNFYSDESAGKLYLNAINMLLMLLISKGE